MEEQQRLLRLFKLLLISLVPISWLAGWYLGRQGGALQDIMYGVQLYIIVLVLLIPIGIWYVARLIERHELDETNFAVPALLRMTPSMGALTQGLMLYLATDDRSLLFCALIGGVSLMFTWPSDSRIAHEIERSKGEE